VSVFCVASPDETPAVHDACFLEANQIVHCDANGAPNVEQCPNDQVCSTTSNSGVRCMEPERPPLVRTIVPVAQLDRTPIDPQVTAHVEKARGCSCSGSPEQRSPSAPWAFAVLASLLWRRRSRPTRR